MNTDSGNAWETMGTVTSAIFEATHAVGEDIEAADRDDTFVSMAPESDSIIDEDGLPSSYDKDLIQKYWDENSGALQGRWFLFLRHSAPFVARVAGLLVQGRSDGIQSEITSLARELRERMEKMGPTFIKLGQVLSTRPDILPQEALDELIKLQDDVQGIPTSEAREILEKEYGKPLDEIFSTDIEPVRAGSLAQVFKARLRETGEEVAVKVQRPGVRALVAQDMYALRRAALTFQTLFERFAPNQNSDMVKLLDDFAMGWYTELDFANEGRNMDKMRLMLQQYGISDVLVPKVHSQYTTTKVLVSQWVDGTKLSDCKPEQVQELVDIGQKCFFTQLFKIGFFHSDPHPGNLLRLNDQSGQHKLALIDFGIVTKIKRTDVDSMIAAVVDLSRKDYDRFIDDFIELKILPSDCNRKTIIPLLEKTYAPYFSKSASGRSYVKEVVSRYGVEAILQDFRTVFEEIPFSIPSNFGILARAIVTLDGVAMGANPDYKLFKEVYKYVFTHLLGEGRVTIDQALKFILSDTASSLRAKLVKKAIRAVDVLLRQAMRKELPAMVDSIPTPMGLPMPGSKMDLPAPFLLPALGEQPARLVFTSAKNLLDALAPRLSAEEEIEGMKVTTYVRPLFKKGGSNVGKGDLKTNPLASLRLLIDVLGAAESLAGSTKTSIAMLPPQLSPVIRQMRTLFGAQEGTSSHSGQKSVEAELKKLIAGLNEEEKTTLVQTVNEVSEALLEKLSERANKLQSAVDLGQRAPAPAPAPRTRTPLRSFG